MRIPCAATLLLLATSPVIGCPLQVVEEKLAEADDYLYWHELWDQSDTPSATFELDNAIGVTRQALELLDHPACGAEARGKNLTRIVAARLQGLRNQRQTILRSQQASSTGAR